jgi:hypothetical protein
MAGRIRVVAGASPRRSHWAGGGTDQAARRRLVSVGDARIKLGHLDAHSFRLFLSLLGDALAAQTGPDEPVERLTSDGSLFIRLVPLEEGSHAEIETEHGRFSGRDHRILIRES